MRKFSKYIGLDVHKETIVVGIADARGGPPRYWGKIANRPEEVRRFLARLAVSGERLRLTRPERMGRNHHTGRRVSPRTNVGAGVRRVSHRALTAARF